MHNNIENTDEQSRVDSNTIADVNSRSHNYFLTINNYTELDIHQFDRCGASFYAYQIESGENGVHHIQGIVHFKSARIWPKRWWPRAHIEVVKNFKAAYKYCTKEDTRVKGPFIAGDYPQQGRRTDLEKLANSIIIDKTPIDTIAKKKPRNIREIPQGSTIITLTIPITQNY